MPAVEFNIFGGEYKARSPLVNNQDLVNMFPVQDSDNGKPMALYSSPGLVEWTTIAGNPYQVRALQEVEDNVLCAVVGDTVYFIESLLPFKFTKRIRRCLKKIKRYGKIKPKKLY